jgi:hypothetical protein
MTADVRSEPNKPWFVRGKALIIAAGAIAAALLAIWGLWDRLFVDTEDNAQIESVTKLRQMSVEEFAASGAGLSLGPSGAGDAHGDAVFHGSSVVSDATAVGSHASPAVDPNSPAGLLGTTIRSAEAPNGTPTEAPESEEPLRTETEPPNTTDSPTTPPATSATPNPTSEPGSGRWSPPIDYLEDVSDDPAVLPYDLPPTTVGHIARTLIEPTTPEGDNLSSEELAARLKEAFDEVESQESAGRLDPQGWVIAVDLSIQGLAGVPLMLTWTLDGVSDVDESWTSRHVAYTVVASTASDHGSAQIWVPRLKADHSYQVNVQLSHSDGTPIDTGDPLLLGQVQ